MSDNPDSSHKLARIAFSAAMHRAAGADGEAGSKMKQPPVFDDTIGSLIAAFEAAAQQDDAGADFWFARDLQVLLGYTKWDNFLAVITKARSACEQVDHSAADHFADVGKMVSVGSGAEREIEDIVLSRYALSPTCAFTGSAPPLALARFAPRSISFIRSRT